ncbi:kinase-like domain-containing protein [Tanacetum coccineum]
MTSSTPLQVPYTEIKSVTNNFSDESVIGEGFLGKIYGGELSLSGEVIDVAFRRLDHSFWLQDIAFDKEFSMLSRLSHKNLVSNVGFCIEMEAKSSLNEA